MAIRVQNEQKCDRQCLLDRKCAFLRVCQGEIVHILYIYIYDSFLKISQFRILNDKQSKQGSTQIFDFRKEFRKLACNKHGVCPCCSCVICGVKRKSAHSVRNWESEIPSLSSSHHWRFSHFERDHSLTFWSEHHCFEGYHIYSQHQMDNVRWWRYRFPYENISG